MPQLGAAWPRCPSTGRQEVSTRSAVAVAAVAGVGGS